jgi:hypothetical protein
VKSWDTEDVVVLVGAASFVIGAFVWHMLVVSTLERTCDPPRKAWLEACVAGQPAHKAECEKAAETMFCYLRTKRAQ